MKLLDNTTSPSAPRTARRTGLAWSTAFFAAAGLPLALLVAIGPSCSAGKLDCDEVGGETGAMEICEGGGDDDDNMGGAGGNMGGAGGQRPRGCDPETVKAAALAECADHATVDEFEDNFLRARCGKGSACHSVFPPRFEMADNDDDIFPKLAKKAAVLCPKDLWINPEDALASFFYTKVLGDDRDRVPCPSDDAANGGTRMPQSTDALPEDPLTDDEKNCLKSYVEAVAANCNP